MPVHDSRAPDATSIPALFEAQVARYGDRLAVSAPDGDLTYAELNRAANRVAHAIVASPACTATVAVLQPHGASSIAAMLGVCKAGKVVVPIDTRQPVARMRRMLNDSDARLLLADTRALPVALRLRRPGLRLLDTNDVAASACTGDLRVPIDGHAPACIMYTSGSTGTPKGVVQSHGNHIRRTAVYTRLLGLVPEDRITMLAACSVAQGLSSALQALLTGASLHLFDLRDLGVGELAPWIAAQRISVFVSTVSTFRHFASTLVTADVLPTVRMIRLGSERIRPGDVELYRRHFSRSCTLIGTLGSTEAGPIAACRVDDSVPPAGVPAGYPVDGATITIVDDEGGVCPPGGTGEIAVHSPCVFSEYWRDPARTAAAFRDGLPTAAGTAYLTGDVGRLRPDGCLECLGRARSRVKIRGFRVELEEIEHALVTHPLVADAAVVEQRGDGGDSRLRAYIVTRTSSSTAADDLRTHLRHSVPDYMVPASFEIVEALPRTASGKVNRPVLEACAEAPEAAATAAAQRLDPTETRLTQIWEDLLGRRPLPAAADFFDSGGDSLLAARLSVAIERAFGVRLPLSTFVAARTVRAQAQVLRTAGRQTEWPSLIPLRSSGSRPPIFCFHLIDGDVLGYRDLARHLPADQPVYGLQSRGLDGISRINTRIEDMAHDYVREIRARFPTGPYALCGWSYGGRVAFEVARQLEQEGQHVALLALLDSRLPLPQDRTLRMHLEGQVHRKFAHLRALVRGPARLAYAGAIVRRRWESASQCVGRMLVLWQRRGGWLPRSLRSVVRANRCARHDYVPTPYGGRITLFKATDRWDAALGDPFGRWTALAGGGISIHEVPGTHGSMIREPLVRTLAEGLAQCLDAAWARAVIDRKCDDRVA